MGSGDISQLTFEDICTLCRKYSRSKAKRGKGIRDAGINKSTSGGATRIELVNLLENFKANILGTLSSQLDTIKTKRKQDEEYAILSIFCSRCRKMNPLRECPLNVVSICGLCADNHSTEYCPSFHGLTFTIHTKKMMATQNAGPTRAYITTVHTLQYLPSTVELSNSLETMANTKYPNSTLETRMERL